MFDYVDVRSYHRRLRTRLPSYQPIIEQAAELNNFDWRLIAAQIYQESHFDPAARSHARDLARQFNLDPNRWASLKETLPLLRYRKYYKNSRYGYCRGTEPINYVRHIFFYYDILKRSGIEYGRIHDPAGSGAL